MQAGLIVIVNGRKPLQLENFSDDCLDLFVKVIGEKAFWLVVIFLPDAFMLDAAVNGHEEKAAGFENAPDGLEDGGQVGFGDVEQAVEGIDGVEMGVGEIQVEEIHDVRFQPFGAAEVDHFRRQIGAGDGEAIVLEETAVMPWPRSNF